MHKHDTQLEGGVMYQLSDIDQQWWHNESIFIRVYFIILILAFYMFGQILPEQKKMMQLHIASHADIYQCYHNIKAIMHFDLFYSV
jgi:hypothetical protein